MDAPLPHRCEQAHAALNALGLSPDLDLQLAVPRHLTGHLGEGGGRQIVVRRIDQVAGQVSAGGQRTDPLQLRFRELVHAEPFGGGRFPGFVAVKAVSAELHAQRHFTGEFRVHAQDADRARFECLRCPRRRHAQLAGLGRVGGQGGERHVPLAQAQHFDFCGLEVRQQPCGAQSENRPDVRFQRFTGNVLCGRVTDQYQQRCVRLQTALKLHAAR